MVKIILELMAMAEEMNKSQAYLRQLLQDVQGLEDYPATALLQDRLTRLECRLQDMLTQWTHLGLEMRP